MRRIQRPIGVSVIAVYDVLVVGVIPLLTFVLSVRNSDEEVSFFLVLTSVALYFCVMGAAVWAWSGEDTGRWILLAAVTTVAFQWIVNAILVLARSDIASRDKPSVIGFISRGSIALALNWWYFNRKTTVAYYKQSASKPDHPHTAEADR